MSSDNTIDCTLALQKGDFSLVLESSFSGTGVTAIFGRSGSGKTTLLRCLAGLERAIGVVSVRGAAWQNAASFLPAHQRPVGYVFQEANLFQHLNVQKNLDYAWRYGSARRADKAEILSHKEIVALCGIEHLLTRLCHSLSGGERQRVAIARALLTQPQVLLMDEPLASLDESAKKDILNFLLQLKQRVTLPIIFVSHSVSEVARIADEVMVLEAGRVVQQGHVSEVFSPNLLLSYEEEPGFLVEGVIIDKDEKWGLARAGFSGGELVVRDSGLAVGQRVKLYILAKDVSITLSRHHDSSMLNILPARIINISDTEKNTPSALVLTDVGETQFLAKITCRSLETLQLKIDQTIFVQVKTVALL